MATVGTASVVTAERSWFGDADRPQRTMRITPHAADGVVTLSLWEGSRCTGTHRIPHHEVPTLIAALADGLAQAIPPAPPAWRPPPPPPPAPSAPPTGRVAAWRARAGRAVAALLDAPPVSPPDDTEPTEPTRPPPPARGKVRTGLWLVE